MRSLFCSGLVGFGFVALASGCGGPSEDSAAGSQADTSDIASMQQRPDGSFDVRCSDGTFVEQVPVADVQSGNVCQGLARSVALGWDNTYVVTRLGGLKAWGSDWMGSLGIGSPSSSPPSARPVDVLGLGTDVASVASGWSFACALTTHGAVKCWGQGNSGQVGAGSSADVQSTPTQVAGLTSGIRAIAAGAAHACALTSAGKVKCWGQNNSGQLGNPIADYSAVPVDVQGLPSAVKAIAAGSSHTCAVLTSGAVMCWGLNEHGQLGNGTTTSSTVPVRVTGLTSGVETVALGVEHSCAKTRSGGVACWGWNRWGQVGNGSADELHLVPQAVSGLGSNVASLGAGGYHSCVVTNQGVAKCWGSGNYGQLGTGTTGDQRSPANVSSPGAHVRTVALGMYHSCLLADAGSLRCFGYNGSNSALGLDPSTAQSALPVSVWH